MDMLVYLEAAASICVSNYSGCSYSSSPSRIPRPRDGWSRFVMGITDPYPLVLLEASYKIQLLTCHRRRILS